MANELIHDDVMDAAFDEIANNATILTVCSDLPTSRTEAVSTYKLADVTIDSSDFTNANGDTSGRKVTVSSQSAIPIDASGTAAYVCICDGSRLLVRVPCEGEALVSGGTVTTAAFKYEIPDPTGV